ncbi:hypothetical protein COOONC_18817 [Cooperia oncophora]
MEEGQVPEPVQSGAFHRLQSHRPEFTTTSNDLLRSVRKSQRRPSQHRPISKDGLTSKFSSISI